VGDPLTMHATSTANHVTEHETSILGGSNRHWYGVAWPCLRVVAVSEYS